MKLFFILSFIIVKSYLFVRSMVTLLRAFVFRERIGADLTTRKGVLYKILPTDLRRLAFEEILIPQVR